MARNEDTPDCGVRNCTRAAFKFGVCRKHHAALPPFFYLEAMGEVFKTHERNNKRAVKLASTTHRV